MTLPGPVSAGDPIKAADFNSVVREIRALKQIGNRQGRTKTSEHLPAGVIRVRNDFAFRLRRWDTVGVDDMLIDTEADVLESLNIGQTRLFSVTKPQPRHVSRWAVLHQPLMPGEIGLATVEGVAPVAINYSDIDRTRLVPPLYQTYRQASEIDGMPLYASQFASDGTQVDVPTDVPGEYNYNVDWGGASDAQWMASYHASKTGALLGKRTAMPDSYNTAMTTPGYLFAGNAPETGNYNGPAQGSVLHASLSALDGFPENQITPKGETGATTFKCINGRWTETASTCEDGTDSWYYVSKEAAAWLVYDTVGGPDPSGFAGWNGLKYPCVEDNEIADVPCRRIYRDNIVATAVLAHPERRLGSEVLPCNNGTTCVYECRDFGTEETPDWRWLMSRSCKFPCHCVEINEDLYPCDGVTQPMRVQYPCRPPTTTTTTTSSTTTSGPPQCDPPSGSCSWRCDYYYDPSGDPTALYPIWGGGTGCPSGCACPFPADQPCDVCNVGATVSPSCITYDPGTTTTTSAQPCNGVGCTWRVLYGFKPVGPGEPPEFGYFWGLVSDPAIVCSPWCDDPCSYPEADPEDYEIGDQETFPCTDDSTECTTTTTSEPPCGTCSYICTSGVEDNEWLRSGAYCESPCSCPLNDGACPEIGVAKWIDCFETTTTTSAVPCSGTCRCTCNGSTYVLTANNCSSALNCNCECPNTSCASGETFVACFVTTTTTTTTTTSAPPTTTTTTTTTTSAPPTTTTTTTTTTSAPPTTTTTTTTTSTTTTTTTTTTTAPPTGACCVDGFCTPDYTEEECTGNGGIYVGNGTGCSPDPCTVTTTTTTTTAPPTGACCQAGGLCAQVSEEDCGVSGTYLGDGTSCDPNPCPP